MNAADLPLHAALHAALAGSGIVDLTPVQEQALPPVLAARDVVAEAPTGSGKTIAFGIGVLQRIDITSVKPQALIVCPTRELADQVAKVLRRLGSNLANLKVQLLTGGLAIAPQLASLRKDSHVIVGTPGRILEMLDRGVLHLAHLRVLVVDEADRMLDMGFEPQLRAIVAKAPKHRQTLLFSATFPDAVRVLGASYQRDAVEIRIGGSTEKPDIDEQFFEVDVARKDAAVAALLRQFDPASAIVFTNTRRDADDLVEALAAVRISALALHGDIEQRDREEVLVRFGNRSCRVLVASDVAARGLDIADVGAVVNYELPHDTDTYLHRIGRTARAGGSGLGLSLVAPREMQRALAIEAARGDRLRWTTLDGAPASSAFAATMTTLRLDAGRTDKMRAGDILGALTGDAGIAGDAVGKIDIFPTRSYVAIRSDIAPQALERLRAGRIKGRSVRVTRI